MLNVDPHAVLKKSASYPTIREPTLADVKEAAAWFGLQTFNDPAVEGLISAALKWGRTVKHGGRPIWLALLGRSGIGKSVILEKLWKTQYDNRRTDNPKANFVPHFIYWPRFADQLRKQNSDACEKALDMIHWPFLFLDDISAERDSTGFVSDKLNTILGSRAGMWTVIASNKTLDQLAAQEIRIADRMQRNGGIIVESTAISFNER